MAGGAGNDLDNEIENGVRGEQDRDGRQKIENRIWVPFGNPQTSNPRPYTAFKDRQTNYIEPGASQYTESTKT